MRPLARLLPLLALATTLSCADMPTAPSSMVTVTGQITDRDGPGIEQVYVMFISLDPRNHSSYDGPILLGAPRSTALDTYTATDANGRFRIQLPTGPYRVYLQPLRGYPYTRLARFDVAPGHTELNYRFTGVRITGTVTGPGGLALPGGSVYAFQIDQYDGAGASSDLMSGRYSLLVPPGTYRMSAEARATFGTPVVYREFTASRDTTIDVILEGTLVTGIVRGQNGAPLERIRVQATSSPSDRPIYTYSLADGSYSMYLPSGTYAFHLEPWDASARYIAERDYPPVSITAPTVLDFDMSGVEWSGTVKLAWDSTAVTNAGVVAVELRNEAGYNTASIAADGAGRFHLIVARNTYYSLYANVSSTNLIGTFATDADTTFDLYVQPRLP